MGAGVVPGRDDRRDSRTMVRRSRRPGAVFPIINISCAVPEDGGTPHAIRDVCSGAIDGIDVKSLSVTIDQRSVQNLKNFRVSLNSSNPFCHQGGFRGVYAQMPRWLKPGNPPWCHQTSRFGNTYGEWSARWWQWILSVPADKNPNLDTTGAHCAEAQSGSGMVLGRSVPAPFRSSGPSYAPLHYPRRERSASSRHQYAVRRARIRGHQRLS